jgi:hypothetical protein
MIVVPKRTQINSNGSVAKTNNNKKEKIVQSKTLGSLCGIAAD